MHHQSLHFDFSVITNDESVQTIKDKRKYKSQQLFNTVPWSWHITGVVFSTGMGPSQLEVSPDLNHYSSFSSGRVLASCICAAAWCCCCHGNCAVSTQPISSFSNPVNRQLSADAFPEEIIHNGHILNFDELYQPVLGVRFFLGHSVYVHTHIKSQIQEAGADNVVK